MKTWKQWVLVAIITFFGMIIGCSTTTSSFNPNWDRAASDRESMAFYGYVPDYDLYQKKEISEVFNSFKTSNKSFDGYYKSENVIIVGMSLNSSDGNTIAVAYPDDVENRTNNALGGWKPANAYYLYVNSDYDVRNKMSKELNILSIVTIWYRGIYRYNKGSYGESRKSGMFLDKYEVTGQYEMKPNEFDIARAERQAERQQPRFSPEGKEYVKKTLTQAVGEVNNSTNRGKTLFFESDVSIKDGVTTGQYLVSEILSNSYTIMYYYERPPFGISTILYRVEISNIGVSKYVIDSFR